VSFIATALGTKVAIAALSLVVLGGGTAVAASAGALPSSLSAEPSAATPSASPSDDAPETEAPTAEPTSPSSTPSPSKTRGPDATGHAAFGLCTAYTAGGLNSASTAYAALLRAAQSSGSIASYCGPILAAHPGNDDEGPSSSTNQAQDDTSHGDSSHGKDSGSSSDGN
jgi:hypothetical protein